MDHPFEIGKQYKNHIGRYQVLTIEPPKMLVRYDDGREQILTIETQARIWTNMAIDERAARKKSGRPKKSKRKRRGRAWSKRGHKFTGLKESDFKTSISYTTWRGRQSLGGLVGLLLSEATRQFYQSYAVARRPQVHIYLPDHFDTKNGYPYAKLELRLDETAAYTRFYVEKGDESSKMNKKWHWYNFLHALETDKKLQKQILQAMIDHDLYWNIEQWHDDIYNWTNLTGVSSRFPLFAKILRQDPYRFQGTFLILKQIRILGKHLLSYFPHGTLSVHQIQNMLRNFTLLTQCRLVSQVTARHSFDGNRLPE